MPAEAAPILQFAERSLRAHGLLFGAVILATFQAGLALSTTRQLLREEQEEIDSHFRRLSGALLEQERFMHRWNSHARMPAADPPANQPTSNAPHTTPPGRAGMASAGLGSVETDIPFSMLRTEGNLPPATAISLGTQFFNFYAAYWSASHYPSPRCLLVDGQGTAGLLVPLTVDNVAPRDASKGALTDALGYIHGVAKTLRRGEQHWYPYATGDGSVQLASIAQAPWDAELWSDASDVGAPALACLLDVNRIDDHEQALGEPIYDQLSIIDQSGRLIHGPDTSLVDTRTRAFTTAGVIYRMRSEDGLKGIYQVGWSRILGQPGALLIGSILVALLLVLGGLLVLLGYRRSKVEPLHADHEWLLESQAFSQTVLDAAPVGLCLLRHSDDAVILENALARSWLGEHHAAPGWQGAWRDIAPPGSHPGQPPTWSYDTPEGRHLLVAATEARYRGEPATLYLFIDLTLQHETELLQRQAREAADQANRAKSLFLTTMNHEIRTPLYGVLGTLELLGLTPLNSRQREYVGTIQHSSSALVQLISDILDASKAEAGQLTLEPVAFCPARLTEDVLRSYAGPANRKRLQLYGCIDGGVMPMATGDASRIRQVLNNLVSNAIKFTNTGRVVLRLRMLDSPDAVPRLSWQVTDTGIGIQPEHQARLFEPFYQANPGTDAMRGTGLGLAISAHLVSLMGGSLQMVSDSGLGSSFSFELALADARTSPDAGAQFPHRQAVYVRSPARELADKMCERLRERGASAMVFNHDAPQDDQADTPLLDLVLDGPLQHWPGPHVVARCDGADHPEWVDGHWLVSMYSFDAIVDALLLAAGSDTSQQLAAAQAMELRHLDLDVLVAEDNPINQMILREQLEQIGCHAVVASDGDEALGYWAKRRFDAILTDINMPHVDGYTLARRLRDRDVRVPIIGATANASPEERERCQAAGMDSCLVKPISLQAVHHELSVLTHDQHAIPTDTVQTGIPSSAPASIDTMKVSPHMRDLFLTTMRSDMRSLASAANGEDPMVAQQMLHRIRGALTMVSADDLAEAAQAIEDDIDNGTPARQSMHATHIFLARLERALVYLERELPEHPDAR